jgi:hypothetical protein
MTLAAHVDHLRTLAALDPESSVLDLAVINVLQELAEAVDGLRGLSDDPPPDDGEHFGTT